MNANQSDRIQCPENGAASKKNGQPEPEELREQIEETRSRVSQTARELQDRLTPSQIKEQAWETAKDVTIGPFRRFGRQALESARSIASSARSLVTEYPVPSAVAGLGAGWLLLELTRRGRRDQPPSSPDPQARPRESEADIQEEEKTDLGSRNDETAETRPHTEEDTSDREGQAVEDSSFVFGSAGFAAGAALGLALPNTRNENRWMGTPREKLIRQFRQAVRQKAVEKTARVATDVVIRAADAAMAASTTQPEKGDSAGGQSPSDPETASRG